MILFIWNLTNPFAGQHDANNLADRRMCDFTVVEQFSYNLPFDISWRALSDFKLATWLFVASHKSRLLNQYKV